MMKKMSRLSSGALISSVVAALAVILSLARPVYAADPAPDFDQGLGTADFMSAVKEHPGPDPRPVVGRIVITDQESAEDLFLAAIKAVESLPKDGSSDKKFSWITYISHEVKVAKLSLESKKRLFQALLQAAGTDENEFYRLMSYGYVAQDMAELAKAGRDLELFSQTFQGVEMARKVAGASRSSSKEIFAHAARNHFDHILNTFTETVFPAETQTAAGAVFEAAVNQVEDPRSRALILADFGSRMVQGGWDRAAVSRVFAAATKAAKAVEDASDRCEVLVHVAKARLAAGLEGMATELETKGRLLRTILDDVVSTMSNADRVAVRDSILTFLVNLRYDPEYAELRRLANEAFSDLGNDITESITGKRK